MSGRESAGHRVTVVDAAGRYRWLFSAVVVLTALLVMLLGQLLPSRYSATASLVFRTPAADITTQQVVDPKRFVEDQAAVLQLPVVAATAAELATADLQAGRMSGSSIEVPKLAEPPTITQDDVEKWLSVQTSPDANLVRVSYASESAVVAATVTNAVVQSYQEVRHTQAEQQAQSAIDATEASIEGVTGELDDIAGELRASIATSPGQEDLDARFDATLQALTQLEGADLRSDELQRLSSAVKDQVDAYEVANRITRDRPEIQRLLTRQEQALTRLANLQGERDRLVLETATVTNDLAIVSPADLPDEPSGLGLGKLLVIGLILGLLPAAMVSYLLASSRPRVEDPYDPQAILGAPMLAEIPDFKYERTSDLPVLSSPGTQAAESFRFAAASLGLRRSGEEGKVYAVVSATAGEGKSVIVANLSLSIARTETLLSIDTDLEGQGFSRLLLPTESNTLGLSDVLIRNVSLDRATRTMKGPTGAKFEFVTGGKSPLDAREPLTGEKGRELLDKARQRYSLVLLDLPPLLSVAYASELLRRCDGAIVVTPHEGQMRRLEELSDRLQLIGVPLVGYVYNRAPHRPERSPSVARSPIVPTGNGADKGAERDRERPRSGTSAARR